MSSATREHGSRCRGGPPWRPAGRGRRWSMQAWPPPSPCPSDAGHRRRIQRTRKRASPDTEPHGNGLETGLALFASSKIVTHIGHFPCSSVSRAAGFSVGWRRCSASPRRGRRRMRACTLIRPRPAGRGRSPAPPPASVFARSAQPRTLRAFSRAPAYSRVGCVSAAIFFRSFLVSSICQNLGLM